MLNAVIGVFVSFFIGIQLNAPARILTFGSLTSGAVYMIFILSGSTQISYFIAAAALSVMAEFLARLLKTPTTVFLIMGVYILVPGSGIYRTISYILENDYQSALKTGTETFIALILMAAAIAVVTTLFIKSKKSEPPLKTDEKPVNDLLNISLELGKLLLENGAETYRAESAVLYILKRYVNGNINVLAIATAITIDIETNGMHYSGTRCVLKRSIDLGRLDKINSVSRKTAEGIISIEEAVEILQKRVNTKAAATAVKVTSSGIAAGLFVIILGGGIIQAVLGALCCILVQTVSLYYTKVNTFNFFISFLGGLIPAIITNLLGFYFSGIELIITGAMLPFFPGISTINAIRDAMNGDLLSGTARAAEALLTATALAIGVMLGFALTGQIFSLIMAY